MEFHSRNTDIVMKGSVRSIVKAAIGGGRKARGRVKEQIIWRRHSEGRAVADDKRLCEEIKKLK